MRDFTYWLWERQMPGKGKYRLFKVVGFLNRRIYNDISVVASDGPEKSDR